MNPALIVVVPCGGKKMPHPAAAGDLYVGSYHRACRRAADRLGGRTLILSALHGLLELDEVIEPYDLRMGERGSVTDAMLRYQAEAKGLHAAARVVVLAGRAYADRISRLRPDAERPLDGSRGIGEQLARLNRIGVDVAELDRPR